MNLFKIFGVLVLSSHVFASSSNDPIKSIQMYQKQIPEEWLKDYVTMATIGQDGYPTQRTMRIHHISNDGFIFHTNDRTGKVQEFTKMNRVSILFLFLRSNKDLIQISVKGKVAFLGYVKSKHYRAKHDEKFAEYILHPVSIKFTFSDSLNQKNKFFTHHHQLYHFENGHWTKRGWSQTITKYEKPS
jgi:pyridoxine/pyridoxamine 5'-phosphate oxidase